MTTSIYPSFQPIVHRYMANEKSTSLKIQIEPWAFDMFHEHFPESGEYDYRSIRNKLSDCILKYQRTVADKLNLGTEIMFDFSDSFLIFEVKNYSQNFNKSQIEEIYMMDLSRIEKKHNNEAFLREIEKNKEYYY